MIRDNYFFIIIADDEPSLHTASTMYVPATNCGIGIEMYFDARKLPLNMQIPLVE